MLEKKGLKALLDLSPKAGPVSEVRSLGQQDPGGEYGDLVGMQATTNSSTISRRSSPERQGKTSGGRGGLTGVCRTPPLLNAELRAVPGPPLLAGPRELREAPGGAIAPQLPPSSPAKATTGEMCPS